MTEVGEDDACPDSTLPYCACPNTEDGNSSIFKTLKDDELCNDNFCTGEEDGGNQGGENLDGENLDKDIVGWGLGGANIVQSCSCNNTERGGGRGDGDGYGQFIHDHLIDYS